MNFTDKVIALEDDARKYILSKVKDGEKLELISKEELDNVEDDEILWELPNVEFNNKYNELITYAIIGIDREGESLDLYGYALGDYLGDSYIFTPYELTANQLCFLADYLK
jgi:hypothetical protein